MPLIDAALQILGFSIVISLASALARRVLLKEEDLRKMQEAAQYRREMMKAMKAGDKKAIQKLEKRKDYIQKIEAQTAVKNLATMAISIAIFFSFYMWATNYYGAAEIMSMPPGLDIPFISNGGKIFFYGWYILTVMSVGLPINKFINPRQPSLFGGGEVAETKPKVKKQEARKD